MLGLALTLCSALSACAALPDVREHRGALWHVVHDLCVPDQRLLGAPAPCQQVDLKGGWAVVKDTRAPSHILLVPTRRITGIEDPALLEPGGVNYWQAAWEARGEFQRLVGKPVPREDIGMAINSIYGRTQDQLHIHIDCIRPGVAQAIAAQIDEIGPAWAPLRGHVVGAYRARRVQGADFGTRDPFLLLAHGSAEARADMAAQTMVAVGATFPDGRPGFVLMARKAKLAAGDLAAGEGLLDHTCQIVGGQKR